MQQTSYPQYNVPATQQNIDLPKRIKMISQYSLECLTNSLYLLEQQQQQQQQQQQRIKTLLEWL